MCAEVGPVRKAAHSHSGGEVMRGRGHQLKLGISQYLHFGNDGLPSVRQFHLEQHHHEP